MNEHSPAPSHHLPLIEADEAISDPTWELAARCGFTLAPWRHIAARAQSLGADPFDLAVADGVIAERDFVAALATLLEAPFTPDPPAPAKGTNTGEAFSFRSYPVERSDGGRTRVIAPGGALAGILLRQHREGRRPAIILTLRQALLDRLVEADAAGIAHSAAFSLPERFSARYPQKGPEMRHSSKGSRASLTAFATGGLVFAGLLAAALVFPMHMLVLPPLLLAPIFIVAGLSVLTATFESGTQGPAMPPVETALLPRYSLLVPLYREGNIASQLITQLAALIYPRDRLEAFLLVEGEDEATLAALKSVKLEPWMQILLVPPGMPRTKPRALNAALPFCSGDLTVVFDAEDAPDADQLLRAAAQFKALPDDVACLQGRLVINNVHDNFLTRCFTIDYAALFDCIKAGMGRAGWPVPLGGSSNHFRTEILRNAGGWDAWNVTEDADLGLRLARLGWRVEDLRSTTWEEAPNTLASWMNQRTRWLKGWFQTFIVHAREPRQLFTSLGFFRTMIITCTGISVLLGALLYPVFLAAVAIRLADPVPLGGGTSLLTLGDSMLVLAIVVALLVEIIPAMIALRRRKAMRLAPYILLAPLTHLLVSIAAWRALLELIRRPFHWHKTMHGQARHAGGLSPINGE